LTKASDFCSKRHQGFKNPEMIIKPNHLWFKFYMIIENKMICSSKYKFFDWLSGYIKCISFWHFEIRMHLSVTWLGHKYGASMMWHTQNHLCWSIRILLGVSYHIRKHF